jgi:glycosyltransferase involved in cell wall biosynthesis
MIVHSYHSFQKDQIEEISSYFNHVYVLVRYKPIAEIANILPINVLKTHTKQYVFQLKGKPNNVTVIPVKLFYMPTNRSYKRLGSRHFKAVFKIIEKNKIEFDLIHAHFTWSAGYVGSKLKEIFNVPFVLTSHRYDLCELPFIDDDWKNNIRSILNSADANITVSFKNLPYFEKIGVFKKINVIVNGFNRNLFSAKDKEECRRRLNLPLDQIVILTVGNLVKRKGHIYIIRSLKKIITNYKNLICIFIGDGPLRKKLLNQIKANGLENHFILTGSMKHSEIEYYMNACDVFLLSSLSEGNPTVMFECLGCGKPFVASNVGGISDIINSDEYGLLFKPANTKEMTNKILQALNTKWDREKILDYSQKFRWDVIVKDIVELYRNCLHSKHFYS